MLLAGFVRQALPHVTMAFTAEGLQAPHIANQLFVYSINRLTQAALMFPPPHTHTHTPLLPPLSPQVYQRSLAATSSAPVAQAAANLATKAFRRVKGRLALPDKGTDL